MQGAGQPLQYTLLVKVVLAGQAGAIAAQRLHANPTQSF
jgi:hypothetical protein